jgi:hypothetical protein
MNKDLKNVLRSPDHSWDGELHLSPSELLSVLSSFHARLDAFFEEMRVFPEAAARQKTAEHQRSRGVGDYTASMVNFEMPASPPGVDAVVAIQVPPKRTRMRRLIGSRDNSFGSGSDTRNRPIASGESGPCCQDSPTALSSRSH